jgi:hypothetical protein
MVCDSEGGLPVTASRRTVQPFDRPKAHTSRKPFIVTLTQDALVLVRALAMTVKRLAMFVVAGITSAAADPEADIRAALRELGGTSYAWETTIRQRSNGEAANLSLNPNAPLEVTGKTEREGYTEVTLLPSKQTIDAPVTAFTKFGDAVGHTPLGWLRRTEIRDAEGNEKDRLVPFEGKSVRLSRAFAAAMRATSLHTPLEEVFDLISEVKSYREAGGYLIGDLRDAAIEKLWGDPKAKSAPEIQGNLIFKISDGVPSEVHILLAIGFPGSKKRPMSWSVMQWTTRIKGVGETRVEPPTEVVQKLEQ